MNLSRRTFITGLFAPAIVSATSIMPVKLFVPPRKWTLDLDDFSMPLDPSLALWYKGKQPLDAGIFYCPYVPLIIKQKFT